MKKYRIGVVGATGLVGRTILELLEERQFPVGELYLFASLRSKGKKVEFSGREYVVEELSEENLDKCKMDIVLMSAGSKISRSLGKKILQYTQFLIDNSSAFRRDPEVPLVVPSINMEDVTKKPTIIANPNCSTIQLVMVLDLFRKVLPLESVEVVTLQSVSGSGQKGIDELKSQIEYYVQTSKYKKGDFYPTTIFSNLIPFIGDFSGFSCEEEEKIIFETRKILHQDDLKVDATTIRVPVFYSHSEVVRIKFSEKVDLSLLEKALIESENIEYFQDVSKSPFPLRFSGKNTVGVGRLRPSNINPEREVVTWVVADNLRVGAALNAIRIAEEIVKKGMI